LTVVTAIDDPSEPVAVLYPRAKLVVDAGESVDKNVNPEAVIVPGTPANAQKINNKSPDEILAGKLAV
jgi:hypothetical protein